MEYKITRYVTRFKILLCKVMQKFKKSSIIYPKPEGNFQKLNFPANPLVLTLRLPKNRPKKPCSKESMEVVHIYVLRT